MWEREAHIDWSMVTCPGSNQSFGINTLRFTDPVPTDCRQYVVVVVFFTLTDRASTIPDNTRGCQSGTWSAGQKKIRGTSTKLQ